MALLVFRHFRSQRIFPECYYEYSSSGVLVLLRPTPIAPVSTAELFFFGPMLTLSTRSAAGRLVAQRMAPRLYCYRTPCRILSSTVAPQRQQWYLFRPGTRLHRLGMLLRYGRIPFLVYSVYQLGYQQGVIGKL